MAEVLDGIDLKGFSKPVRVDQLQEANCRDVTNQLGVYIILLPSGAHLRFLRQSTAGWFKGKNPTVERDILKANWVPKARVLYIGKAGGRRGLRGRLRQFMQFAQGGLAAHRGGRYLWQLKDSGKLLICWKATDGDPGHVETEMIQAFRRAHGMRPFANHRK